MTRRANLSPTSSTVGQTRRSVIVLEDQYRTDQWFTSGSSGSSSLGKTSFKRPICSHLVIRRIEHMSQTSDHMIPTDYEGFVRRSPEEWRDEYVQITDSLICIFRFYLRDLLLKIVRSRLCDTIFTKLRPAIAVFGSTGC